MKNVKRFISVLMAIVILLSLAACGGSDESSNKSSKETKPPKETEVPTETTDPVVTEPAQNLTVHENTFFSVAYNEEDGWSLAENDIYSYDGGGNAHVRILNEEGRTEIVVSISAEKKDPESFREALYVNGVDLKAYASGEVETTDVGGQPMLYVDQSNGDRFYYGRNESAGVSYTIDATNWEDPRVPALVAGITCTASGTDNIEPPWPWEGEPFFSETMSQMIGTYTLTGEFLAMSEPLTTFETFKHDVEVIGDKVYLLSDYVLREYALEDSGLTFIREIPLDDEYEVVESADGTLVLSSFMRPVIGHDGNDVLYSYEGPDKFTLAPDGTWGISWFSSGKTCEKFTFRDGALVGEEFPFNEIQNIRQLCIDSSYIYVSGSPVEGSGHTVFVYDHSGVLQFQLSGDPNSSIGLGSISFVTKVGNAILAVDGNMRDLVLWTADGTWIGSVDVEDLFGTYYPWMASADVMPDGSILVVMTEDRADDSAMETLVFRVTLS